MTRRMLVRVVAVGGLASAIAWALAHRDAIDGPAVAAWLDGLGPWAALAFVGAYALAALLFLPGSALALAGGAAFGPVAGGALSLVGATLGATLAFLFARSIGGAWVERRLGGRMGDLVRGVEDDGWRFVAFVRLVPLFPYNLLNYALGLTRIPLGHYVAATAVCMIPGAAAFSYLGHAGREALTGTGAAIQAGLLGLALLATAIFVFPRLAGRLRQRRHIAADELRELQDSGSRFTLLDLRSRDDFYGPSGHIPGAECIPIEELPEHLDEMASGERGPVIVCCTAHKRSTRGARILRGASVRGVRVLRGGVDSWRRQGHPLVVRPTREAP